MNISRIARAAIFTAIVLVSIPIMAQAKEKKITKKDLPAAVLTAFQNAFPHAQIRGLATETEHKTTYYEIESVDGKTHRDLLYTADGKPCEIEETIAPASLPGEVLAALKTQFPKAKLLKAEQTTRGTTVTYDLTIRTGKSTKSVTFDPAGNLQKTESEADEKKEGEKDDTGENEDR